MKRETAKLVKDLASHEKEEVKLQEKKKHAVSKHKKLRKTLTEVRSLICNCVPSNPIAWLHRMDTRKTRQTLPVKLLGARSRSGKPNWMCSRPI